MSYKYNRRIQMRLGDKVTRRLNATYQISKDVFGLMDKYQKTVMGLEEMGLVKEVPIGNQVWRYDVKEDVCPNCDSVMEKTTSNYKPSKNFNVAGLPSKYADILRTEHLAEGEAEFYVCRKCQKAPGSQSHIFVTFKDGARFRQGPYDQWIKI